MSNLFEDLSEQAVFPLRKPTQQTAPEYFRIPSTPQIRIAQEYDGMVVKVLQQLLEIVYPKYGIRNHSTKPKNRYYSEWDSQLAWSIGFEDAERDTYTSLKVWRPEIWWHSQVVVTLVVDNQLTPLCFECFYIGRDHRDLSFERTDFKPVTKQGIRCGLSEVELVTTLRQLHGKSSLTQGSKPPNTGMQRT